MNWTADSSSHLVPNRFASSSGKLFKNFPTLLTLSIFFFQVVELKEEIVGTGIQHPLRPTLGVLVGFLPAFCTLLVVRELYFERGVAEGTIQCGINSCKIADSMGPGMVF